MSSSALPTSSTPQDAVGSGSGLAADSHGGTSSLRIVCWNVNGIKTVFGPNQAASTGKAGSKASESADKSKSSTAPQPSATPPSTNYITSGGPDLIPIPTFLAAHSADILCLQETKLSDLKLTTSGGTTHADLLHVPGHDSFMALSEEKKGYSGTAIYVPEYTTVSSTTGRTTLNDVEGRCVEVDLGAFVLINLYCPNGGRDLDYKFAFYERLMARVTKLVVEDKREVAMCGDFNIAHTACDIWNPDKNKDSIGFSPRERALLDMLASPPLSLIDIYRHLHPDNLKAYTFWDMRTGKRATNQGWRIDYFWITPGLLPKVKRADVLTQVLGSDHCPILLELEGVELCRDHAPCKEAANRRHPKPRSILSFFAPKTAPSGKKAVIKQAVKRDHDQVDDIIRGAAADKINENERSSIAQSDEGHVATSQGGPGLAKKPRVSSGGSSLT